MLPNQAIASTPTAMKGQLTWSARRTGRVPPWSSRQQRIAGAQLASCFVLSFA
jgi:hypothetical protein